MLSHYYYSRKKGKRLYSFPKNKWSHKDFHYIDFGHWIFKRRGNGYVRSLVIYMDIFTGHLENKKDFCLVSTPLQVKNMQMFLGEDDDDDHSIQFFWSFGTG